MNSIRSFARRDLAAVLFLGLLVAVFFWRILTPNPADRAQFPPGDFTDQFYAFRLVEARALAEGRLPLWSENYNSGHPFLADVQSAVYYPPGLANTLLNVALTGPNFSLWSLELEALLHFWLAAAFMYLFARRSIGSRAGALLAAVVFAFGGYLTSYPPLQLAILETAAWLPLALYLLDRAAGAPRPMPWLAAVGLTLGVAGLAGHPQTWLFVLALSAAYWLLRARPIPGPSRAAAVRSLLPLAGVLAVAAGIAAAQYIPSLEYMRLSVREEGMSFSQAAAGLPTLDLLQFLFPGFTSAFASPLYVGILPLWLALYALLRRGRAFWGLTALAALVLAFGLYVFAYVLLYLFVPGVALFRQQERLAFIVSFALAVLAGFGLKDLSGLDDSTRDRVALGRFYLLLPAGMVLSLALLVTFFVAGAIQPSGRLSFLGDRAGLMLLVYALAAVLVGLFLARRISPRLFIPLAIALVLFDLWSVNEPANKGEVQNPYPANSLVEQIRRDPETFRVAGESNKLPGHFGIGYDLEETGGISPLRLAAYDLLDAPSAWPLLNVKYVVTDNGAVPDAERIRQDGELALYQLKHPLPRAWLVGAAEENVSAADAARRIQDGLQMRQTALVAGPLPFPPDPRAANGRVEIESRSAERMTLSVESPADGLLVVSENDYPGWIARVDGAPVDILRADVTLRGVPVRAGAHHVELVYDPLSVKIGLAITLVTLLACLGVALVPTLSLLLPYAPPHSLALGDLRLRGPSAIRSVPLASARGPAAPGTGSPPGGRGD